jgi:hypothetical protein
VSTVDDLTRVAPSVGDHARAATADCESVVARLQRRFPAVPPARVRATVHDAVHRLADSRISLFLPVLIERIARDELTRREAGP